MFSTKAPPPPKSAHCLVSDVGISVLNSQHLRLASYAMEFNQLVEELTTREINQKDWKHVDALFSRIMLFVSAHFRDEEDMMQENGFPEYKYHKKLHDKFVDEMADVQSKINNRKIAFSDKLSTLLWDFLYGHINDEDSKYGEFYREKGISA
ncbi:MAG: hemerythrin family protein [Gammaproteobacteria bacterium]|nr:hemerythrin family protein [Gammaproteobacteria bacterium]